MLPKLIMITEAATVLGWSHSKLRRWTNDGKVRAAAVLKPRGDRLYDEDYIRELKETLNQKVA